MTNIIVSELFSSKHFVSVILLSKHSLWTLSPKMWRSSLFLYTRSWFQISGYVVFTFYNLYYYHVVHQWPALTFKGFRRCLNLLRNTFVFHTLWYICSFISYVIFPILKVIHHLLYGMNNYVLIWGDWLLCDPLKGSHDSQSPHIYWLSCDSLRGSHDSQSPHIRKHLCPILWQLWFICHKIIHTI